MNARAVLLTVAGVAMLSTASIVWAHAPSGAIFTTNSTGSEVNVNQFPTKPDVYLDGGPGPGAPQGAAGLDDGTYVFQVTDPSGKVLLSTDPARCRQFVVTGGVITSVVATGCQHLTGNDIDHNAKTVQLYPFNDTPNNGGVYKAWVVRVEDYVEACKEFGVFNALDVVDPGRSSNNFHGFIPDHCKTDNFKVGPQPVVEIDTRFYDSSGQIVDGRKVTWFDTNGASNQKWSYYAPSLLVNHEAHVEGIEAGFHKIQIDNQAGCTVDYIVMPDGTRLYGAQTVTVHVPNINRDQTYFIDVHCR